MQRASAFVTPTQDGQKGAEWHTLCQRGPKIWWWLSLSRVVLTDAQLRKLKIGMFASPIPACRAWCAGRTVPRSKVEVCAGCARLRLMRVCELQSWLCTSWVPLTGRGLLPLHIYHALRDVTVAQLPLQLCDQAVLCTALPSMCEQFPMSPGAKIEFTPLVSPPLRPRFIAVPDKLVYRKMFWTLLTNFLLTLIIPR